MIEKEKPNLGEKMIIEKIATGETIEEAIANAKAMLGDVDETLIHTEIIEMPRKKVLGLFGGTPAKAKASVEIEDKPEKKPTEKKPEKPAKKAEAPKPAPQPKKENVKPKNEPKKAEAPKPKPMKAEAKNEPSPKNEEKAENENATARKPIELASSPALVAAAEYLKTMVLGIGVKKCEISAFETEDGEVLLELDCDGDDGILIGKWGETLDSIQYLTRLCANRIKTEGSLPRINVNVGNYRQKRNQYLKEYAGKKAKAVLKYGRNITLDPMNPYERRIVHTAIQEIDGVTSFSVGSEGERKVVITLEEGVKPLKPQRGGRNSRGSRGGRQSQKIDAPQREKKTDEGAKSVGLYGKLN